MCPTLINGAGSRISKVRRRKHREFEFKPFIQPYPNVVLQIPRPDRSDRVRPRICEIRLPCDRPSMRHVFRAVALLSPNPIVRVEEEHRIGCPAASTRLSGHSFDCSKALATRPRITVSVLSSSSGHGPRNRARVSRLLIVVPRATRSSPRVAWESSKSPAAQSPLYISPTLYPRSRRAETFLR